MTSHTTGQSGKLTTSKFEQDALARQTHVKSTDVKSSKTAATTSAADKKTLAHQDAKRREAKTGSSSPKATTKVARSTSGVRSSGGRPLL